MAHITCQMGDPATWSARTLDFDVSASYDPRTNRTTVELGTGVWNYFGLNGYLCSHAAQVAITATDGGDASGAAFNGSGLTNGGPSPYFQTAPSPGAVTVQHGAGTGKKYVRISVSASHTFYYNAGRPTQVTLSGGAEITVEAGERQGAARLDLGSALAAGIVCVDLGTGWAQAIPEVDKGGSWAVGM